MMVVFCAMQPVRAEITFFFQCGFSCYVWKEVPHRCSIQFSNVTWNEELQNVIASCGGKSFGARILRIAFCVSIYCLWQERNKRIFQQCSYSCNKVLKDIEDYVSGKTRNWRVKRTLENWEICKKWGIVESILM